MRTTLTIDDAIMKALKQRAVDNNQTFKEVVNDILSRGLESAATTKPARRKKFKQRTVKGGKPPAGINLVKANQLVGELEDEEFLRKMELRK